MMILSNEFSRRPAVERSDRATGLPFPKTESDRTSDAGKKPQQAATVPILVKFHALELLLIAVRDLLRGYSA